LQAILVLAVPIAVAAVILQALRQRQIIPDFGIMGNIVVDSVIFFMMIWIIKLIGGY
jgi:hypothetical protein